MTKEELDRIKALGEAGLWNEIISTARTAIPELIAEIERLEKQFEILKPGAPMALAERVRESEEEKAGVERLEREVERLKRVNKALDRSVEDHRQWLEERTKKHEAAEAELELLQAEADRLEGDWQDVSAENDDLRRKIAAAVESLRRAEEAERKLAAAAETTIDPLTVGTLQEAYERGRSEELVSIVAWIRKSPHSVPYSNLVGDLAECIERGEHRKEKP